MIKSEAVVQVLEDLGKEGIESEVVAGPESKAVIFLNDLQAEDENGLELNAAECRLVFANQDTLDRLMEALYWPDEASLCLFDVTLPAQMLDRLERYFTTVDEG